MSNCLNCTCECIPDPGDDGQPERVDHAARADQHLLNATCHDTLDADQNLVAAQAEATLALADQQEIANLIAFLDHVDGERYELLTGALTMILGLEAVDHG